VVVGAAREAPHPIRLGHSPAQHDHREIGVDPPHQPVGVTHAIEQVKPAATLERKVQDHEARTPDLDPADPLPRTRRPRDPEASCGKVSIRNARVASSSSTTRISRCSSVWG
jgi:hypothetical protein